MTTFRASREIPATPADIFDAIATPARLARWWGPDGFRNTFEVCEFRPGGSWLFTMHGPDGSGYPNESTFVEIEADRRVVIDHLSRPRFRLTVELSASGSGTLVDWAQTFEDPATAAAVRPIVEPANEQNLRRLHEEVLTGKASCG